MRLSTSNLFRKTHIINICIISNYNYVINLLNQVSLSSGTEIIMIQKTNKFRYQVVDLTSYQ